MKNQLTLLIASFFLSILPAMAQTADQDIAAGTNELGPVADNLTGANANFAAAVALQPTNETGNVLWGMTRLLTLPQTTAGNTFLNNIGFTLGSRDFYNWSARPPKDANGNVIFPAGLNSSTAATFILTTGIPTFQACDTNLSVVTDTTFTLFLPAAETTGAEDVTLDYGDIQMLRALVEVGEFFGYTVNAQNFNVVVPTVESMLENNTLTLQSAFSSFPSLLTLSSPANLTLSKTALTNAIAHYFAASDYIRNVRSPSFTGLFNLSPNDANEEAEFRTDLTNFLASLQGPAVIDARQTFSIDSSNYFSGAKSLRSLTPQFNGNEYVINTMPDYTFGGILSGVPAYVIENLFRQELPVYAGIFIGDGSQFYNNGYAVSDSNGNFNGSFAAFVSTNGQATLIGHDDGDGLDDGSDQSIYEQFTVNTHGDWSISNSLVSGFGQLDRSGDFGGELDYSNGFSIFLNGALQSPYGQDQALAGLFSGPFTGNNHSGQGHVIVAADGEIFLVPVENNNVIDNGISGNLDNNNQFSDVSISGTLVQGTLTGGVPPVISGTFTNSGSVGGTFRVTRTAQILFDAPPAIVVAPVNRSVEAGSNAVFTVTASGSPPLTYQWSVNGTNIFNATNSTLIISNCTLDLNGNVYAVGVTNLAGSTNAVADLAVGDFIPPTLGITNLASGVQVSNANFVAMGKAWDNASVSNVFYNIDATGWQLASVTIGASTNWMTGALGLTPGPNTLLVYAQDENGNDSITDSVNFIYVQSAPLTVFTNSFGWGTLNPNYSGTPLQIAKTYSITATALPGFAFLNWTGGTGGLPTVLTNKATVTFLMQQNLQLTANFIDITRPGVILTNITAGMLISNSSSFTAMGRSWDNVAVTNVFYNFNSNGWLSVMPSGSATNWSVGLTLNAGTNTLAVYAQDPSGNVSPTNSVSFQYVVTTPLIVTTNNFGWGTLSPSYNGTNLQIGRNYSITATAVPGFAFTNWTGGTSGLAFLTNKTAVTFIMEPNLELSANFLDVTKPTFLITNVTAGQSISNANFAAMGRSWDNVGVSNIFYNFNSNGWLSVMPSGSATNWTTGTLGVTPGPNTISVYAQDGSGNVSPTNTVAFTYVVSTPLTVLTNSPGWGTLSPNDSGVLLAVSKSYSITATAAAGFAFTNWTGGTNINSLTLLTNKATVTFLMQTDQIVQANFIDITKPGVILTNITAGMLISNSSSYTAMGRSWDNVSVTNVFYNFNSNGWLSVMPSGSATNWSVGLTLNAGTNTLAVYAQDPSGNVSPTNSVSFQYVVTTPLIVTTNNFGWGTLSPSYNGTNLQIGRNYSITATAVPGFAFTNWTGGTSGLAFLTNKTAVTFIMEPNLELSANFLDVTKPTFLITNVTAGQSISNANFAAMGRSWDNVGVSNIFYNFNSNGWLSVMPSGSATNWTTGTLGVTPGPNTISVYAQDGSGNVSPTNTVAFTYVVSTPLTVLTNSPGWGTLSPNDSGVLLAVSKSYSITATAAAGFAFTNWTGGTNINSLTLLTNKATVTFLMQTDQIVQANFIDITRPGVILTNITAGMLISNSSSFTAMGRSWDNVSVTNVFYNFNSNGWLSVMPSGSATNWSVPLTLNAGTNTLAVYAQDPSGNVSPTNNVSFQYVVTTPLIVTTNSFGWGTLSPNYNGQNLQIGRNYSITATALPGFVFSNWSGDPLPIVVLTNGPTVTFMMEPSLELFANFRDTIKPSVIITNITSGMVVTNIDFTAMGRSWDNSAVANVFYNFNSNGWQTATPGIVSSNWSAALMLNQGSNTLAVYAQDTGGNVSPTNTVAFKSLGYYTLTDYYPLPLNAQWTYGGTNAAGQDEDLLLQVLNTDFNLTLYTGPNPAQTYQTNSLEISERFLDPDTVTFTGSGNVFDYAGPLVGMYGDDLFASDGSTNDSFRVDHGIIFPAGMAVGTSVTNSGAAYQAGTNVGTYTVVLQLLAHTNLDVFAGNFSDVLYLRQTVTLTNQPVEVDDYWWARSVGLILQQGVSGNDALIYRYLASSTLLAAPSVVAAPAATSPVETKTSVRPSIAVQTANPGGPLVFNLTGPTGQTVVVEGSADLIHWQPLQTNTLKSGSIYFSDSQSTNYPARFYRIHSP